MSVSLCIIVKNEEENLARCLSSVKSLADEIILVDTGSTDHTLSIAQQYNAKIYHCPWNNSFSQARNYSMSKATGTWILVMDADDALEPDDFGTISALTQNPEDENDIYCCKTLSFSGNRACAGNILVTLTVRLIRNGKGYRYVGRIHEQLAGKDGLPKMSAAGVRFYHYGYLSSQIDKKEKHHRNIRLIQMELQDRPSDAFMLFNLGNEYLSLGMDGQAIESYETSYRRFDPACGYGPMLLIRMILCCDRLGRKEDEKTYLQKGLSLYPQQTDFEFLKANLLQKQGKKLKAIRAYQKCIRMGPPPPDTNSMLGVSTFKPHTCLSVLYEQLGEQELALKHIRASILLNSCNRESFVRAASLLLKKGCTPKQTKSRLLRLLPDKNSDSLLMLSDLFYDRSMFPQALQLALQAKKKASDRTEAFFDEGICRFFLGQYQRAHHCLSRLPLKGAAQTRPVFFLALCTLLDPSFPPDALEALRPKLDDADYHVLLAFRTLLKNEPCPPLRIAREQAQSYTESIFGLLEILLKGGLLNQFLEAAPLLNALRDDTVLLRLGKLYYQYGYEKLAYHELKRSIRIADQTDAESLCILCRTFRSFN